MPIYTLLVIEGGVVAGSSLRYPGLVHVVVLFTKVPLHVGFLCCSCAVLRVLFSPVFYCFYTLCLSQFTCVMWSLCRCIGCLIHGFCLLGCGHMSWGRWMAGILFWEYCGADCLLVVGARLSFWAVGSRLSSEQLVPDCLRSSWCQVVIYAPSGEKKCPNF